MSFDGSAAKAGYMIALPYLARASYTAEGVVMLASPWGGPLALGLSGRDENGSAWIGITTESPVGWLRPTSPLPDKQLELLHLNRIATDCRIATGYEMFDAIIEEREPPDFVVSSDGKSVGIEMTTLSIERRRQAQGLFFELTSRLSIQQRHRIGHLSGYQLFVWFGGEDGAAGFPFRHTDPKSYDELLRALCRINRRRSST